MTRLSPSCQPSPYRRMRYSGAVTSRPAIVAALTAALFFGASTPMAKILSGEMPAVLLAALLYLGSGLGLWTLRVLRGRHAAPPRLARSEWLWFAMAIVCGGVLGPILLMQGLTRTSASNASLLLNLEAVMTALMAWLVFREAVDRRLVIGMLLIVSGGAVLAWPRTGGMLHGALAIAAACLCWGIDNNLTRKVSAADADFIAGTKGLVAGGTTLAMALAVRTPWPAFKFVLLAMGVGLVGYGVSLVLFVIAMRGLGSARAGAYFSTAPFLGAAIAVLALHEPTPAGFWWSAALMAAGVALHLSEKHSHEHSHAAFTHAHPHHHDLHHQHAHESWDGVEPHTHEHQHQVLTHEHSHYPDLHHRHGHT